MVLVHPNHERKESNAGATNETNRSVSCPEPCAVGPHFFTPVTVSTPRTEDLPVSQRRPVSAIPWNSHHRAHKHDLHSQSKHRRARTLDRCTSNYINRSVLDVAGHQVGQPRVNGEGLAANHSAGRSSTLAPTGSPVYPSAPPIGLQPVLAPYHQPNGAQNVRNLCYAHNTMNAAAGWQTNRPLAQCQMFPQYVYAYNVQLGDEAILRAQHPSGTIHTL